MNHTHIFCFLLIGYIGLSMSIAQGDPNQEQSLDPEGPANLPFEYLNQIKADHAFESNRGIINLSRTIYRDANPRSGYFYYLPASYSLNWDETTFEYDIEFTQGMAREGATKVVVTARLKPNITRKDLDIARKLLELDVASNPVARDYPVNRLVAMPVKVDVSFPQAQNYGANSQDIIVQAPQDFLDPVKISFAVEKPDFLLKALFSNIGLNGTMTLTPTGSDIPPKNIPITIKLDDPGTFGAFELEGSSWRTQGWRNPSDYPVVLKNLHVLRFRTVNGKQVPTVYTWRFAHGRNGQMGPQIPRKALAKIDPSRFPAWIDNHPSVEKVWIEYGIKECEPCNELVKGKIIDVVSERGTEVKVTTLTPIKFSGAQILRVEVRSRQADLTGMVKKSFPQQNIKGDFSTISIGRIYLNPGENPELEYQITLIMPDGQILRSQNWVPTRELEIVIGEQQLKQHFPGRW